MSNEFLRVLVRHVFSPKRAAATGSARRLWGLLLIAIVVCGPLIIAPVQADDWTQWRGSNRDGVWRESGVISSFTAADLKPVWRQPIGTGYSSPTVCSGRVFLMDFDESKSEESVLCFDSKTGQLKWKHTYQSSYQGISYTAGPRAAVTIEGELAYSLGAKGRLHCLNVNDGTVVWEDDLDQSYQISASKRMPIWGITGSPIVVGDLVILQIGAKGAAVVAFNKTTGDEVWKALDDRGQYSSPVLVKQNGNDVLVCWTGDGVAGLNPQTGQPYWHHPFKPSRMPIGVATPVIHGNRIFLTSFYDGAMMLEMSTTDMSVKQNWHLVGENERDTKALNSIISTPIWIEDHIYGVDSYGELRCLSAADGSRVWEDLTAVKKSRWGTIHFVAHGKEVWMLNEQGELMVGGLTPSGLSVTSRAGILDADQMRQPNRKGGVVWSHPAFADRCVFARNDRELICISLAKPQRKVELSGSEK
ncbi:MAG: outer membrane protein assembly factor BamB [Mariniblastus sp.]|jgi:outer membrane protein assembly factor BamB